MTQSLFDSDEAPQAKRLAPALRSLANNGVCLGTSSWKYEGWIGSIYSRDRYMRRGRFSTKRFEAECLSEYAETFPTVSGDFSFYQFPSAEYWAKLFAVVPPGFTFALKVPEEITVHHWPGHARYGPKAGTRNPHFLDANLFEQAFTKLLEPHHDHVAAIVFEFATFAKKEFASDSAFLEQLKPFLDSLPVGWNYGVEIRNEAYLGPDYFQALANRNVAHVFNAWTRMPALAEQVSMPEAFTADFTVVRALLRRGRSYEQAVSMFEPYREVQDPDLSTREALRELVRQSRRKKRRAYIYVNNRLEGNAPTTIEAVAGGSESE